MRWVDDHQVSAVHELGQTPRLSLHKREGVGCVAQQLYDGIEELEGQVVIMPNKCKTEGFKV